MVHKPTIIDSSVWVAYLYKADSQHEKARALVHSINAPVVPEYILLEVTTILRLKKQEVVLNEFIKLATTDSVYIPASNLGIEVASCLADTKYKKLSFVDVALVLLSKKYLVATFDKELQKLLTKSK